MWHSRRTSPPVLTSPDGTLTGALGGRSGHDSIHEFKGARTLAQRVIGGLGRAAAVARSSPPFG